MSLVPTLNYLSLSIGGPLLSENVVNNKLRDHEKQEGFHLVKHDETSSKRVSSEFLLSQYTQYSF